MKGDSNALKLGSEIVQLLMPHRRPFIFVDSIEAFERSAQPTLKASFFVSASHDVFTGHFPQLHLWPGIYTVEGLGQTANLLSVLLNLEEKSRDRGEPPDSITASLKNLELGYRLRPGFKQDDVGTLVKDLGDESSRMGFTASIEMKFMQPVFAGHRLDYAATLTRDVEEMIRFQVEAQVNGAVVASGTLMAKRSPPFPTIHLR